DPARGLPALGVPARAWRDRPDLRPAPAARAHRHPGGHDAAPAGAAGRRRVSRRWFGTDGIRGRVGEGVISADFVLRLGNAYGHTLREAAEARGDRRDRKSTR